jgi:hypothetical protein
VDSPCQLALRRRKFSFEEATLRTSGVTPDIRVATILVANVVVVEADHPDGTRGERVPEAARLGIGIRSGQGEVRLIRAVSDGPVAQFVLVVARRGHPRPVAGGTTVVFEPIRPDADPIGTEVGVAQVAVDQVEQRRNPFDAPGHVTRGG